ncbi:MAG TPA: molybdopterin-dependent oxidoreductase, partial [Candidatus Sulfotelmatobacter sp.]|nr:molybdopterin-dependent oxidoreductase [Candidatus Sulfotelmatobacter sp.]
VPGAELASLESIEQSNILLIVGDLLSRSPVLSRRVNKVKYGQRGNKIIVVDPNKTHTSWFATSHLACRPGTETIVLAALAGELPPAEAEKLCGVPAGQLQQAAADFRAAAGGTVIYVPQTKKLRNDLGVYYAKKLATASDNKRYIVYYLYGNTLGVNTIIDREAPDHPTYHDLLARIDSGEIKSLLMFGEDISAGHAELQKRFRMLKFVVFAGHFASESPAIYDNSIILPLATQFEGGGSFVLADGRLASIEPIVPAAGSQTLAGIAGQLAEVTLDENEARLLAEQGPIGKPKNEAAAQAELQNIQAGEAAPGKPITYFGNNHLVSNFFWYRVNKGG